MKFHLFQNLLFYFIMFTVPTVSVLGCENGHSVLSYAAIACFMLTVFFIDLINLRQYVKKEFLKLELKEFYGNNGHR